MIAYIRMSAGLIVWVVAFAVLYALHGLGCGGLWGAAPPTGGNAQRTILLVAWVAFVVANAALLAAFRGGDDFVRRTAYRIALVGLVSTIVTGLPIITTPTCL